MPKPGEHKTVQARILEYAEDIGWTIVPREEAEQRRSFDSEAVPRDRAKGASLFFDDLLDAKVRAFNPRYSEAEGALRILRLVISDVIMKLLQTVAGFDRPVCCHSGKPNCLRTVALSIVRPASLSLRPSSISCSTDNS